MKFLRAAGRQVIGLFVSDWVQSAVVILILAGGWFAFTKFGAPSLAVLVLLLAGQMIWFARAEATRTTK